MNNALLHHFKQERQHQLATFSQDNVWFEGKRVHTSSGGGGAAGFHAIAAFNSARSHIHFMNTLGATLKASKKRSSAAKRGWKKRKAA